MPLTPFQEKLAHLLAKNRTPDSHLAGGAALHFAPNTTRYSNDLDYFHDSAERVASAWAQDAQTLEDEGLVARVVMQQPGFVRAIVSGPGGSTKVEWAHDSAWRFLPAVPHPTLGFVLHPVDLALNKVLALVGRNEPRDFLDVLEVHRDVLPLGALCWAAAGKDPGFTPLSLLELLRRRGRYRPEDFERLRLTVQVDLPALKLHWLAALAGAESFIQAMPAGDAGCLYWSSAERRFVQPDPDAPSGEVERHFGRPGGVMPALG